MVGQFEFQRCNGTKNAALTPPTTHLPVLISLKTTSPACFGQQPQNAYNINTTALFAALGIYTNLDIDGRRLFRKCIEGRGGLKSISIFGRYGYLDTIRYIYRSGQYTQTEPNTQDLELNRKKSVNSPDTHTVNIRYSGPPAQ